MSLAVRISRLGEKVRGVILEAFRLRSLRMSSHMTALISQPPVNFVTRYCQPLRVRPLGTAWLPSVLKTSIIPSSPGNSELVDKPKTWSIRSVAVRDVRPMLSSRPALAHTAIAPGRKRATTRNRPTKWNQAKMVSMRLSRF